MKRILSALLLCAMILPLAACGGTGGVSTDAETQPSTTVALGPEVTIYGNGVVPVMISSASMI